MEKHQKRIVTEMFKSLQWDLILEQYEGVDYKIKGIKLSKEKAKVTKEHIKKELTDVFEYMLDMQLDSLELDHWLIRWSNINEKSKLEVIFIPRRVIIREDELCPEEEFVVINDDILDTQEKLALEKLECVKEMQIVYGATHLFEESGKLLEVANLAINWYKKYLVKPKTIKKIKSL